MSAKPVEVELKEFYSLDDYLKNGLQTASNGRMIETGGTIYLNATEADDKSKQVKIDPNTGLGVDFTLGKNDTAMQVFIKDPRSTGDINWILPPRRQVSRTVRWKITETIMDGSGNVLEKKTFNSKEEWEAYKKKQKELEEQKEQMAAVKQDTRKQMTGKLQVYDLGFINCDKFYDEPMQQLAFMADKNYPAEYYLVFTDVRGVLKGSEQNGVVHFSSVPKNRNAVILAVSFVGEQAYFYKNNVTIGVQAPQPVELAAVEEEFLDQQMALLK